MSAGVRESPTSPHGGPGASRSRSELYPGQPTTTRHGTNCRLARRGRRSPERREPQPASARAAHEIPVSMLKALRPERLIPLGRRGGATTCRQRRGHAVSRAVGCSHFRRPSGPASAPPRVPEARPRCPRRARAARRARSAACPWPCGDARAWARRARPRPPRAGPRTRAAGPPGLDASRRVPRRQEHLALAGLQGAEAEQAVAVLRVQHLDRPQARALDRAPRGREDRVHRPPGEPAPKPHLERCVRAAGAPASQGPPRAPRTRAHRRSPRAAPRACRRAGRARAVGFRAASRWSQASCRGARYGPRTT